MFRINPNIDAILFELWTVQHPPPVPLSCPLCRPSAASRSMMIFSMIPPTIPASALSLFGSSGCSSSLLRYRGAMASQPESTGQSGTSHSTPMDDLGRWRAPTAALSTEDGAKGIYTWPTASIVLRSRKPSSAASRQNRRSEERRRIGYVIRNRRRRRFADR